MSIIRKLAVIAIASALASAVLAQPVERIMSREGVLYVSGGVGLASEKRLKMLEPQFNLKLVFAQTTGRYLADVRVVLTDSSGKLLLEHVTDGPIFMARVPAGSYRVSATYTGRAQSRTIELAGKLRTEYFRWSGETGMKAPVRAEDKVEGMARQKVGAGGAPPYVSGGIGAGEIAELKAREGDYNLKLVFSLIEGNYIAEVNVVIKSAAGAMVVEHLADGPIFMARLPAGAYAVNVTYLGNAQTRTVKVGNRLRTEYFRWPSNPETDFPVSRWLEPESDAKRDTPRAR